MQGQGQVWHHRCFHGDNLDEGVKKKELTSVFDKHQLNIAKRTLRLSDTGAKILEA
jgi:hypothetical protein